MQKEKKNITGLGQSILWVRPSVRQKINISRPVSMEPISPKAQTVEIRNGNAERHLWGRGECSLLTARPRLRSKKP